MTRFVQRYSLTIVTVALLAGCASYREVKYKYYEPPDVSPIAGATIIGSRVKTNWLQADETTWISAIDGQLVRKGSFLNYDKPVLIQSGSHIVQVEFTSGTNFAQAAFHLDAKPGQTLIAKSEKQKVSVCLLPGVHNYVVTWLEDEKTGQPVSEKLTCVIHVTETDLPDMVVPPKIEHQGRPWK